MKNKATKKVVKKATKRVAKKTTKKNIKRVRAGTRTANKVRSQGNAKEIEELQRKVADIIKRIEYNTENLDMYNEIDGQDIDNSREALKYLYEDAYQKKLSIEKIGRTLGSVQSELDRKVNKNWFLEVLFAILITPGIIVGWAVAIEVFKIIYG